MTSSRFVSSRRTWLALTGCLALMFVGITTPVRAVGGTDYWNGGNGTWDTATARWSSTGAGGLYTSTFTSSFNFDAFFGDHGSAGIVALGLNLSARQVRFDAGGFTLALAGHTLTGSTTSNLFIGGATVFDFASTSSSATFGNSSGVTWTGSLTINNYVTSTSVLRFGTTSGGLSAAQLSAITFTGYGTGAQIDSLGFVTPSAIPEPATYAATVACVALACATWRRKHRRISNHA